MEDFNRAAFPVGFGWGWLNRQWKDKLVHSIPARRFTVMNERPLRAVLYSANKHYANRQGTT